MLGETTTWPYARFCQKHGLSSDEGVFYVGRPDPLPFAKPVRCLACGNTFETGVAEVAPGAAICLLDEPFGETGDGGRTRQDICPICDAMASLVTAIVCAACGALPCICRGH